METLIAVTAATSLVGLGVAWRNRLAWERHYHRSTLWDAWSDEEGWHLRVGRRHVWVLR